MEFSISWIWPTPPSRYGFFYWFSGCFSTFGAYLEKKWFFPLKSWILRIFPQFGPHTWSSLYRITDDSRPAGGRSGDGVGSWEQQHTNIEQVQIIWCPGWSMFLTSTAGSRGGGGIGIPGQGKPGGGGLSSAHLGPRLIWGWSSWWRGTARRTGSDLTILWFKVTDSNTTPGSFLYILLWATLITS